MFIAPIRGNNFRPGCCREVFKALEVGERVYLVREPTNEFDPNAIRIYSVIPASVDFDYSLPDAWIEGPGEENLAFIAFIGKEYCETLINLVGEEYIPDLPFTVNSIDGKNVTISCDYEVLGEYADKFSADEIDRMVGCRRD